MSSLFGSQGTSSIPSSQSQPTQSAGLFSSLGNTQPRQLSSLQLNLGESLKPGQATSIGGGSGLFSTSQSTASQPQQISSLFPSQNNATTSRPFGSSLLSSQQPQQQQNQAGQSQKQDNQQSIGSGKVSQPAYFNSLLEKGKKRALTSDGEAGLNGLPSLQLGLGDIARRARELGGVGLQTQGSATVDGKASA